LRQWPFTLNNVPLLFLRVTAPCDEVLTTVMVLPTWLVAFHAQIV
jgi:hypothetical protein